MKVTVNNRYVYIDGEYRGCIRKEDDLTMMHITLKSGSKVNRILKCSIYETDKKLAKECKKELYKLITTKRSN